MDIQFASRNEERLCTETSVVKAQFGVKVAKLLAARIAQLQAAPNLAAFVFGKPHPLKGDRAGCIGIWLDGANRLVVRPANEPIPLLADGGLDRANVTIVCVEYVGNYHD
jgi:proteic killer suppression protein